MPLPFPNPDLRRRFLRLTVLNVLANVTVPLVSLADTGMLGHLEDLRFLAGVALASVLFDYLYWSLNFIRMSTTGLTAQARGRGDADDEVLILYRSLFFAAVLGFAILLLHPWIRDLGFGVLDVAPELREPAADYFDARIWNAPAVLANFAFLGWFLGREESGRVLVLTLTANLANLALDAWFILGLDLAAQGAGIASAIAQYLSLAVSITFFVRTRTGRAWVWGDVLHRGALGALFRLNGDIFVRTLCLTSTLGAFTALSSVLGTTSLVVNTILLRVMVLVAYFVDGAAFALESMAGLLWGAKDGQGLRRMVLLAMAVAIGITVVSLVPVLAFPRQVFGLLTSHEEITATAALFAWWLVPVLAAGAPAFIYDGLFLGLTAGKRLRNAMILSTFGVFVPLAVVAALTGSNHWLWAALAIWMGSRAVTLGAVSGPLLHPERAG